MKYIVFILVLICAIKSYSQSKQLSEDNQKHWDKAITFIEDATNENDYQMAINEFEQILMTDDSCSDVYYNLGVLHSKLILKRGKKEAQKSKQYFEQYWEMVPSDSITINKEYSKIEARLKKHTQDVANGIIIDPYLQLKDFEGIWRIDYPVILDSTGAVEPGYTSGALIGDWRKLPNYALDNLKKDMIIFYNENIGSLPNLRFKIARNIDNEFRIYSDFGLEKDLKAEKNNSTGFYSAGFWLHPFETNDLSLLYPVYSMQIRFYYKDVNQMYCSFIIWRNNGESANHLEFKLVKCN